MDSIMPEPSAITARHLLISGGDFEFNLFKEGAYHTRESITELGLRKLYGHIDLDAFHNSRERSKEVNQQTVRDIVHEWLSRLQSTPTISASLESPQAHSPSNSASTTSKFVSGITTTHTAEDVLKDIFSWVYDRCSRFLVMWVHDDRRDQTSLIAQVVAEVLHERHELSASFFSSNPSDPQPRNLKRDRGSRVIPTLAYQLSQNVPELQDLITRSVFSNMSIFRLKTEAQLKKLIMEPLADASDVGSADPASGGTRFIVIHGLEDLDDNDFQNSFLHAIFQALQRLKSGNYSQRLLIIGRHTDQLNDCLFGSPMHSLVLQRPIVLDDSTIDAEELKRWEEVLSSREEEFGLAVKELFEHQRAMQQWEERLKAQETCLVEPERGAPLRQEEEVIGDMWRNRELKRLEEELKRRDEVRREKEEELRQLAKVLFEHNKQWEEQLKVKEKHLGKIEDLKILEEALAGRKEEIEREAMELHEQQHAVQQWEERLRVRERDLMELEREAAARREDMRWKEEMKQLKEELQRQEEVRRRNEEELEQAEEEFKKAVEVLLGQQQQWPGQRQFSAQEKQQDSRNEADEDMTKKRKEKKRVMNKELQKKDEELDRTMKLNAEIQQQEERLKRVVDATMKMEAKAARREEELKQREKDIKQLEKELHKGWRTYIAHRGDEGTTRRSTKINKNEERNPEELRRETFRMMERLQEIGNKSEQKLDPDGHTPGNVATSQVEPDGEGGSDIRREGAKLDLPTEMEYLFGFVPWKNVRRKKVER